MAIHKYRPLKVIHIVSTGVAWLNIELTSLIPPNNDLFNILK